MSKCTMRSVLTVLLYAGVAIFLVPYLTGHVSTGFLFMIGGAGLTVVCGLLRCCLTEGDCVERVPARPDDGMHHVR